jgi:signal peptidase I
LQSVAELLGEPVYHSADRGIFMAEQNAGLPSQQVVVPPSAVQPANNNGNEPVSAPKIARKTKAGTPVAETKDSLREIVETVVFVVVLVLMLKSFVAEAFVIPTGSMAETLWGYQKLVTCPKCGFEFPVNCSSEVDPQQGPPDPVVACTCPNCRYYTDFRRENMTPGWRTGDRVLVAKFLYDFPFFGLDAPKRYEVVVFKYPREPQKEFVPLNYIKRLIGLSGETVAIHYGKLYRYEGLSYDDDAPPVNLWEKEFMHQDDEQAQRLFEQGKFRILRKSRHEILAERRIVFDNDFQPKDLVGKFPGPRWSVKDSQAWKPDHADEPKRFDFNNEANAAAWVRYQHLVPDEQRIPHKELISDFMGYNTWMSLNRPHSNPQQNWVGDLQLECDVEVKQAQGQFVLELSKGVDRFQARWDLGSGSCTLVRLTNDEEKVLSSGNTALRKPGTYRLRFANVDERLFVWVDNSLPFPDGVTYDPPDQRGPTEKNDFEPASFGAGSTQVSVTKLKLWRDTYYTVNVDPAVADAGHQVDFSQPAQWDALRQLPVRTLFVQPGHFLCMGDNSPESSDGRSWGLVPRRLLLGRALMIYFPLSRAGRIQ